MEQTATFPIQPVQIPDVFVYLLKGKDYIAYKRVKARHLIDKPLDYSTPKWHMLKPDLVQGKFTVDLIYKKVIEYPGALLFRLSLTRNGLDPVPWPIKHADEKKQHVVHVNLYQARDLPCADENGLIDPYFILRLDGKKKKSSVRQESVSPMYYETIVFDAEMPTDEDLYPELVMHLFDEDKVWGVNTGDDHCGTIRINLRDAQILNGDEENFPELEPSWKKIESPNDPSDEEKDLTSGEVLMSIRVFRKTRHNVLSRLASQPVPDIKPEMRPGFVDIITVGCRNLRASGLASVERPFLEFVVPQPDEDEAKDKTRVSKKPEPENPNFLCRNLIPVNLPLLPVFAPTLRISAFDKSLGGLRTNQLGVAFVDLSAFISEPGAPEEEDVRDDSDDENTYNSYNSDTDADSVSTKHTEDEDDKERDFTDLSDTDFVTEDKEEAEMASFRKHQSVVPKLDPRVPANKVKMYMGDPDTGITRPHEIGSLENNHDLESFKSYEFLQGQGDGLGKRRVVGKWKGYVRVVYDEDAEPFLSLEKINNPETFQIRLYVLNASKLCCDGDMDPEPYIKASLGDQVHKGDWGGVGCTGPSPNLNQYFEFQTSLPGRSSLKVDVFDHNENLLMQDELIGSTIIDLEDPLVQ